MEQRLEMAGIDVLNEVHNIGHAYADEVFDLIFAIQPTPGAERIIRRPVGSCVRHNSQLSMG